MSKYIKQLAIRVKVSLIIRAIWNRAVVLIFDCMFGSIWGTRKTCNLRVTLRTCDVPGLDAAWGISSFKTLPVLLICV